MVTDAYVFKISRREILSLNIHFDNHLVFCYIIRYVLYLSSEDKSVFSSVIKALE